MKRLQYIGLLMLSMSIILAGFPPLAQAECPMMKMQQMVMKEAKEGKHCSGCPKMAQEKQKKPGCCDNAACKASCMGMGNLTQSFSLPTTSILPVVIVTKQQFYSAHSAAVSQFLNTQDRPPKSLA